MNNLRVLVGYEWKKLLKKKLVWIVLLTVCLLEAFSNCTFLLEYYSTSVVDEQGRSRQLEQYSGYEYLKQSMAFARELDGRIIDGGLLAECVEATIQKGGAEARKYREIRYLMEQILEDHGGFGEVSEESFYDTWKENVVSGLRGSRYFAEEDQRWWEAVRDRVETPFTYRYAFGWKALASAIMGIGLFLAMASAICLSDEFAEEHRRRMDQMILCTRNGRKRVFLAKMITGVSFSCCCALLLYAVAALCCFGFQGTGGFDAVLQLLINTPYSLTVGRAALLMLGMLLLAAILMSVTVMVLSELCNNNIAVLAICVSVVFLTLLVEVPERWRILSQIYSWLPIRLLDLSAFGDGRLVHLFGGRLTIFGITAVLYPVLTVLFGATGYRKYRRFQVGG